MSDSDTWVGDAIVDYVKECSTRSIQLRKLHKPKQHPDDSYPNRRKVVFLDRILRALDGDDRA